MLESPFYAKETLLERLISVVIDQVMAEYIAIMVINNKTAGEREPLADYESKD